MDPQPYTRRGLLSTVNSIFDPLGFLAPVVIEGKLLLRQLVHGTIDWNAPLPEEHRHHWEQWRNSLSNLHELKIPREYVPMSFRGCKHKSMHIFSDASELAIAAVGYLKTSEDDVSNLGFVLGKAKVAPIKGHTIPRLELCAAVLAVEVAESISHHLGLLIRDFKFYTDSKVVLGYIHNPKRRFYTYVSNRVQRIRSATEPDQWSYVHTKNNPADEGTRSILASDISDSLWLAGPSFLLKEVHGTTSFEMLEPDDDKKVRPEVVNLKTDALDVNSASLGSHRFSRFSSWKRLVETIARLRHVAYSCRNNRNADSVPFKPKTIEAFDFAEKLVIKEVQKETYSEEIERFKDDKLASRTSSISSLNPYMDSRGLIRVGGRLKNASISQQEKYPILIPGRFHIALLIVRHYHELFQHQGRHITSGAIRSAGFWITGGKRLISSVSSVEN